MPMKQSQGCTCPEMSPPPQDILTYNLLQGHSSSGTQNPLCWGLSAGEQYGVLVRADD